MIDIPNYVAFNSFSHEKDLLQHTKCCKFVHNITLQNGSNKEKSHIFRSFGFFLEAGSTLNSGILDDEYSPPVCDSVELWDGRREIMLSNVSACCLTRGRTCNITTKSIQLKIPLLNLLLTLTLTLTLLCLSLISQA